MVIDEMIIDYDDTILVTGAGGFIGIKVVESLLSYGFKNIRCFIRPSTRKTNLDLLTEKSNIARIDIIVGNLLNREECSKAVEQVKVIYHLAAGVNKLFPDVIMNSVVTTRNLLDAAVSEKNLKRFVNISSFAVYSNLDLKRNGLMDESCKIHDPADCLGEAYVYGKIKQDKLVLDYHNQYSIPFVIIRPAVVFGPGKIFIPSRVGLDTFGFFMHFGGSNQQPLTYVSNCADAIMRAGLIRNIDGETFNIVDDELPTSRQFLRQYKKNVKNIRSVFIPYFLLYFLSFLWEKYVTWSQGQLPPVFSRAKTATYYKGNRYSNEKAKRLLHWEPRVAMADALKDYFAYQVESGAEK